MKWLVSIGFTVVVVLGMWAYWVFNPVRVKNNYRRFLIFTETTFGWPKLELNLGKVESIVVKNMEGGRRYLQIEGVIKYELPDQRLVVVSLGKWGSLLMNLSFSDIRDGRVLVYEQDIRDITQWNEVDYRTARGRDVVGQYGLFCQGDVVRILTDANKKDVEKGEKITPSRIFRLLKVADCSERI